MRQNYYKKVPGKQATIGEIMKGGMDEKKTRVANFERFTKIFCTSFRLPELLSTQLLLIGRKFSSFLKIAPARATWTHLIPW